MWHHPGKNDRGQSRTNGHRKCGPYFLFIGGNSQTYNRKVSQNSFNTMRYGNPTFLHCVHMNSDSWTTSQNVFLGGNDTISSASVPLGQMISPT